MSTLHHAKKALLIGIAGSYNAFSLSLYNLKAYALTDPEIQRLWRLDVIQHPLINEGADAYRAHHQILALAERVRAEAPDLVGFSCYMWNVKSFRTLAQMIREMSPRTMIVWGGPEMSTDYLAEGLYNDLAADFCISGEGELTFLELLRHLSFGQPALAAVDGLSYRIEPGLPFQVNTKRVPFKSLLEIPSPFLTGVVDEDVLRRPQVEANLETQRGCSLRCSYCIYHKDMNQISYNAVDRVIQEVLFVRERGVRRLRFVDANFSSDLDHAKTVMRQLIDHHVEAKVMFELIPGFIDEELAGLFADYNGVHEWNEITLGVGVQTINYEVLRKMRRGIRIETFEKTFSLIEKYRLYAKIDLIIGLPGENLQSIEATLEYFMDRLRNSRAHLLCCHVMRGLPGTELLAIAREQKMVFTSRYEPHELWESPILPRAHMLKCLRRTAVVFRMVNHEGWASREFISGKSSQKTTIRDRFFAARERLGVSNVMLIDMLIEKLVPYLKQQNSNFSHPDFPYAESWWWAWSKGQISDAWLVESLDTLEAGDLRESSAALPA